MKRGRQRSKAKKNDHNKRTKKKRTNHRTRERETESFQVLFWQTSIFFTFKKEDKSMRTGGQYRWRTLKAIESRIHTHTKTVIQKKITSKCHLKKANGLNVRLNIPKKIF